MCLRKFMKNIVVSAAIIIRINPKTHKKELFATQRSYGEFEGFWELPGGKLENGETAEQCIVREIDEELQTEIVAKQTLGIVEYDYPNFHLCMHCIICQIVKGELKLSEHNDFKWLTKENLFSLNWLPADKLILKEIEKLLV